jgi:hypothetical protein
MPSLRAAFTPLIECPARSTVMLSAPITKPSPEQPIRLFASRVLEVSVCPHVTTVEAGAASAATGTAHAAKVRLATEQKAVTSFLRTTITPRDR